MSLAQAAQDKLLYVLKMQYLGSRTCSSMSINYTHGCLIIEMSCIVIATISWKRSIFFVTFQKVKHILYRFITHRVKYFKPLFLEILMIMAYRWKPKIQCLRKLEYYIRSIKKDILNRNVRLLKSMFISMHSILGLVSFCMNYFINAACHGGNQPVAMLRCNEAQVTLITAFRSSALLGLVSLI